MILETDATADNEQAPMWMRILRLGRVFNRLLSFFCGGSSTSTECLGVGLSVVLSGRVMTRERTKLDVATSCEG